ncbi:hypothetical protein JCM5353_006933 [Sporobolomyces roseus]
METEPVPPPLASLPDSAMTIDYETDPLNATLATTTGGGGDEEMGDDSHSVQPLVTSAVTSEPVLEEAEMADDEASAWEKDPMVEEGNSIQVIPASTEIDLTDSETLPEVTGDLTTISTTSMEETPLPAPSEIQEPALSTSLPSPLPTSSELPPPSTSTAVEKSSIATTTNGTSHEEADTEDRILPSEAPLSEGEQADAEQSDYPEPLKSTSNDSKNSNVNLTDDLAPSPFLRPQVDKASLIGIEVPFPESPDGESSSSSSQQAPTILCTYDNTTYSLFRSQPKLAPAQDASSSSEGGVEPQAQDEEEETPTLLTDSHDQQFYFGTLEQLFSKLHDQFPELQSREDELVLDFDEIGVALTEDNVYSRQVSLHDFDRIHLGCGLPGRLHARLYPQSRFSSGFNALAQHVANSMNAAGTEAEGDDSEVTYEQGEDEEDGTVNGDEDYPEESFVTVGEPEDQEIDGPDSQLPREENEGEEEEGEGEDFDLESALAQLDGDDVAAYAEGAAEDYILSEGKQGEEEETKEDEREVNDDDTVNEAQNEGEEVEVTADTALEEGEATVGEQNGGEEVNEEGSKEQGQVEEIVSEQLPETVESEQNGIASTQNDTTVGDASAEDVVDAATNAEDNIQESILESEAQVESAQIENPTSLEASAPTGNVSQHEASAPVEPTTEGIDQISASENVETGNETSNGIEETAAIDEAIDPNDVVIDYDEAFDGSSSAAPPASDAPLEGAETEAVQVPEEIVSAASHSPKRRHDSLDAGPDEVAENEIDGSDAKRPRLEDSTATSTA